jgi:hypothetical protein
MVSGSPNRLIVPLLAVLLGGVGCIDGARLAVELPPEFLGPPPADVLVDIEEDTNLEDTSEPDVVADVDAAIQDTAIDVTVDIEDAGGDVCPPGQDCVPCTTNDDCGQLDDGNLCNGRWVCAGSICVEEPDSVDCVPPGGPAKECGTFGCLVTTGECGYLPDPEGSGCDDGNPCSLSDRCENGACVGGPEVLCDDGNPCTLDTCAGGACAYVGDDGAECDDGNLCTATELCSGGVCGSPTSNCECEVDADCAGYDDDSVCTGEVSCVTGKCRVDPATILSCGLEAGPCQIAQCDPKDGCKVSNAPDGSGCDDGDVCTIGGTCTGGVCEAGAALACGGALCAPAQCGEAGCEPVPPVDGEEPPSCECASDDDCSGKDDGKACNGSVACVQGQCIVDMKGVPDCGQAANNPCAVCEDDGTVCTLTVTPDAEACDDGNACTENDSCLAGACVGTSLECPGGDNCSAAICHPLSGCSVIVVGRPCDDASACTSETCHDGVCQPYFEKTCNDPGDCLSSACDPQSGVCVQSHEAGPCDDVNACTSGDACTGGACTGVEVYCDDGNDCTDDACDQVDGCVFVENNVLCDDGTPCTVGDYCLEGECIAATGACECASAQDCIPYNDGNLCLGPLACVDGQCMPNPLKVTVCDAAENSACLENVCQSETGECALSPRAEGKGCDDGDVCTMSDVCSAGACEGQLLGCDDGNPCTADICGPDGCLYPAVQAETPCDDGNSCTPDTLCTAGVCTGGVNSCECSTDNECKVFDDGNRCNGDVKCIGGECVVDQNTAITCAPSGDPCRLATCIGATGACQLIDAEDGASCEDGNACTTDDICQNGECSGPPLSCDDESPCTADTCNEFNGSCVYIIADGVCDDGNSCTSTDTCDAGVCVGSGNSCFCGLDADCDDYGLDKCLASYTCTDGGCVPTPNSAVECVSDGDTACSFNQCEPDSGECKPTVLTEGTECDDANICTEQESCDSEGVCVGQALDCDDGNTCTDSSCDPLQGCAPQPLPEESSCDDGDGCTLDEACYGGECKTLNSDCSCVVNADCPQVEDLCLGGYACLSGNCVKEEDVVCSVNPNLCRLNVCDSDTGECSTIDAPGDTVCTDGDLCTLDDSCYNGICTGNVNQCDDGNPCTADECSAGICINELTEGLACDDGDPCTIQEKCKTGECGSGVFICSCFVDAQCKVFDDGDACNGQWKCLEKKCTEDFASEVVCLDDPTDCVKTSCHPVLGTCISQGQADGTPCDDGSVCTDGDECFQGGCIATPPPACPDDDATDCVIPACHPALGTCAPFAAEEGVECNDNDACTEDEACESGLCSGSLAVCDDGSVCTVDDCSKLLGCTNTPLYGPCDDSNVCTDDTVCGAGLCGGGDNSCGCQNDNDCTQYQVDPCQESWKCVAGACVVDEGTSVGCEPSNDPCLVSTCDSETGACTENSAADYTACDDADLCTSSDLCVAGVCGGTGVACDDGNSCTEDACGVDGGCTNTILPGGTTCDDGVACNGDGACAQGVCESSDLDECPCAADEDCAAFEDGNLCKGTLVCGGTGECVVDVQTVVVCPAAEGGCTAGLCNEATGSCDPVPGANGTACDDGDLCTVGDACDAGVCKGLSSGCEDGDACTLDSCDPDFGCIHQDFGGGCDDGDPCTINDACMEGVCEGEGNPCDDGIFCTNDGCQDGKGCIHLPKNPLVSCEDNNPCTVNDKCNEGGCTGQNLCACGTDDDCAAEDDGDKCFGPLSCVDGVCLRDEANFVACLDDEPCRYWQCAPETGECFDGSIKEGQDCDDGDACTQATLCAAGDCVGEPVVCDPSEGCVENVCEPFSGCQAQDKADACDDSSPCTVDDRCIEGECQGVVFQGLDTDLESGELEGWTLSSTGNQVAWAVSSSKAFGGLYSLYAGNQTTGDMEDNPPASYSLQADMPILDLGQGATAGVLSFVLFLDVEDQGCGADFLSVKVNGAEIFSQCDSTGGVFVPVEIDLDIFLGGEVTISFVLNTVNAQNNKGLGVYIDDIDVERTCEVAP